jgi:putative transposase
VNALAESVGERAACALLGSPRATLQRHRKPQVDAMSDATPCPKARRTPRRLSEIERRAVSDHAHSERFCDRSVRQIYATLLDEGVYLASISTWYRVLRAAGETRERRRQATHPALVKPELIATQPGHVWTWDITKLLGPTKWTYYYLYVILDIYSRYVVAWRLEYRESATLAREMIEEAITCEGVDPRQLTTAMIVARQPASMSKPGRDPSSYRPTTCGIRVPFRRRELRSSSLRASPSKALITHLAAWNCPRPNS